MFKIVSVPVQFNGTIDVSVNAGLHDEDAILLAEKIALSRVIAHTDNPDAPESDAFEEYCEECSHAMKPHAERDWDSATVSGPGGMWSLPGGNEPA